MLADDIGVCLANICRQGYLERRFPSTWKIGKLKPACKAGERVERGHYRPLAMLPIASKVYEAVICNQLDEQVDLTRQRNQWAYKKGTSTESLLLYLSEVWKNAINNGRVVGVLFIDCSKAFDSIDHQILKQKLKAIGITGQLYHLLESYLEDRQQFTEVNGVASELRKVKYGVPQGSLLGPRMFSIYMNDISEIDSTDDAVNNMQYLANEITQWCVKNRMTINAKKTDAMIIQKNTFVGPLKPIEIASDTVNYKTECKLLGCTLTVS